MNNILIILLIVFILYNLSYQEGMTNEQKKCHSYSKKDCNKDGCVYKEDTKKCEYVNMKSCNLVDPITRDFKVKGGQPYYIRHQ